MLSPKYTLLCAIIFAINALANGAKAAEAAPPTEFIDGIFYLIWNKEKLSWYDARDFCHEKNMKLVSFENADKLENFAAALRKRGFVDNSELKHTDYIYWTSGTNDNRSTFVWAETGNEFEYTNWRAGQPDNWRGDEHCVEMGFLEVGKWNDNRCRYRRHFVCEREVKPVIVSS